ncbi:hypothetical protein [Pseudomonas shahriarae]|uniref:hypothetical protein n=1 Tax=Pseudomonas shahriarae TaxID=2745512 RepID=UPI00235E4360|nr:hypothetical protein [Pseudomonas shahriarae]MDD0981331.1 hypothetical protein [Pseudomonas shahriarae]
MQIETFVIVFGLLACWIATAVYLQKAVKKAYLRGLKSKNAIHDEQMQGLRQDLHHQIARRQAFEALSPSPCSAADHELLTQISTSLAIALNTWKAFPGTKAMTTKVTQQRADLALLAAKLWVAGYPAQQVAEDAA